VLARPSNAGAVATDLLGGLLSASAAQLGGDF
jgi:hypothetical protein